MSRYNCLFHTIGYSLKWNFRFLSPSKVGHCLCDIHIYHYSGHFRPHFSSFSRHFRDCVYHYCSLNLCSPCFICLSRYNCLFHTIGYSLKWNFRFVSPSKVGHCLCDIHIYHYSGHFPPHFSSFSRHFRDCVYHYCSLNLC